MPYEIVDETKNETAGAMRDAARPYVLIERYHGSYKDGGRLRTSIYGRYETVAQAKRRLRYLETGR
jgi:hypothetical protein